MNEWKKERKESSYKLENSSIKWTNGIKTNQKIKTNFHFFQDICTIQMYVYENNSPIHRKKRVLLAKRFNVDQRKKRRNCAMAKERAAAAAEKKNPPSHDTDMSKWKANKNTTLHGYIFRNMYNTRGAQVVKMHTQVLLAPLKSNSKHYTHTYIHTQTHARREGM